MTTLSPFVGIRFTWNVGTNLLLLLIIIIFSTTLQRPIVFWRKMRTSLLLVNEWTSWAGYGPARDRASSNTSERPSLLQEFGPVSQSTIPFPTCVICARMTVVWAVYATSSAHPRFVSSPAFRNWRHWSWKTGNNPSRPLVRRQVIQTKICIAICIDNYRHLSFRWANIQRRTFPRRSSDCEEQSG